MPRAFSHVTSIRQTEGEGRASAECEGGYEGVKVPIHVRVWLGELGSGAGLGYISPHTHEQTPNFARTFQYPE
jgi:hypothetical protein